MTLMKIEKEVTRMVVMEVNDGIQDGDEVAGDCSVSDDDE